MSKLPKDGYPASSKGFDMRDIERDDGKKAKSRIAAALQKFSQSKLGKAH